MPATLVDAGENELALAVFKDGAIPELFTLKLYTAVSPALSETTVAGDFTEATFGGYAAKALTTANWTVTADAAATDVQTFTHDGNPTSPQTVLGYYIVGTTSGTLYWAEAFGVSRTVTSNGDEIRVTVTVTVA